MLHCRGKTTFVVGIPKQDETLRICRWKQSFSNKSRYVKSRKSLERRAGACLNFENLKYQGTTG